jgi:UDP-N-acetylglucosamine 2-epimerase (non-hydrolysing)
MAAAIVAKKRGLRLAHLVAGTRSFDISMPKEINRLVIDGLSDLLFTAGAGACSIATREGAELNKIYMVGNILIDSLRHNRSRWRRPEAIGNTEEKNYLVFTINRRVLLKDTASLQRMLDTMTECAADIPVFAPLREVAAEKVRSLNSRIVILPPLNYLEFGWLTAHAKGIITDSGNVAEEATFNNVPCLTINSYTEHIETVRQGTNVLVGEDPDRLRESLTQLMQGSWKSAILPNRWDGRTAERIVQILTA